MRLLVTLFLLLLQLQSTVMGQSFPAFLRTLGDEPDSASRARMVAAYLKQASVPIVADSSVTFLYAGEGTNVAAPSELNGWDPSLGPLARVAGTRLFYRRESLPRDARLEYKIWVDSAWILDALNPRTASGGYGENSDVWMPRYVESLAARYAPGIRRGKLDTLRVASRSLGRTYPVFVYSPPGAPRRRPYPVLYVTDGGDYLTHGRLDVILDNLIAAKAIAPIVAVFIDPHAITASAAQDFRMVDYAASDAYLDFLEQELAPKVEERYNASALAQQRVILGASMGGVEATYAVLKRPAFVGNCAVQSPAYYQADSAILRLAKSQDAKGRSFYIDSGTLGDTETEATLVTRALRKHGADVKFSTYHEGHNWTSWRARLPLVLKTFFPRKLAPGETGGPAIP